METTSSTADLPILKTNEMQRVEARHDGRGIEAILHELYVDRQLTLEEVGAELGVTKSVVSRWLERCRIPARKGGKPRSAA